MAVWSWRKWPDVLIDFGRELYVAWRLSEGDALYRDVAHFNGPLSAWWNAFWFRVAGVGFDTLIATNLVLLALLTALLYGLFARAADRTGAALAGLVFVALFAFGQLVVVGNYTVQQRVQVRGERPIVVPHISVERFAGQHPLGQLQLAAGIDDEISPPAPAHRQAMCERRRHDEGRPPVAKAVGESARRIGVGHGPAIATTRREAMAAILERYTMVVFIHIDSGSAPR